MSVLSAPTKSVFPAKARGDKEQSRFRFALVLPVLMAVLLVAVTILGRSANLLFALVLFPLVIYTAFADTERAVYVYCAWCWMDGTIRGVFGASPVVILGRDLVLALIVVGWAVRRLRTRYKDPIRTPPLTALIYLFIVNCLLQVANPFSLGLLQSLGGLKVHLSVIPLVFIGYDIFRSRSQVKAICLFLTLATVVIAGVSIVQYTFGADWTYAHFPGTASVISQEYNSLESGSITQRSANTLFKPPGTTLFGGGTAGFVGLVFPLTFAMILMSGRQKLGKILQIFFVGIMFVMIFALFVNGVRSALVEAIVGVVAAGLLVGGILRLRTLVAVFACLGLGLAVLSYSQAYSNGGVAARYSTLFEDPIKALHDDRKTFFEEAGYIAAKAPFGVGLGRTGAAAGHLGGKNNLSFDVFSEAYLGNMIFETGVIGALLITAVAVGFLRRAYQTLQGLSDPDDKLLVSGLLAVLIVIFLLFFTVPVLYGPPGSVFFWLFAAMLLRVYGSPAASLEGGRRTV